MFSLRMLGSFVLLLLFAPISLIAQNLTLTSPVSRIVYQRDLNDQAEIYVTGTVSEFTDLIQVNLHARTGETGTSVGWKTIAQNINGSFSGMIKGTKGRYDLEIKTTKSGIEKSTIVEKVGIGEVFLIVGHSNAAGIPENSYLSTNDLISSIDLHGDQTNDELYKQTASPQYLPFTFTQLCKTCGMAPFGYTPVMWSKLGELLVQELQIPVLFYSAAFGGSSMSQTRMSAQGIHFDHDFINADIGMPYVNIANTLTRYTSKTGIRAVLSSHGINDAASTGETFFNDHMAVIAKTRESAQYMKLAWMVATSCYNGGIRPHILAAQQKIIDDGENIYQGPDLNAISDEYRGDIGKAVGDPDRDRLHFNAAGVVKAGEFWFDAILSSKLLEAEPISPQTIVITPLPVTLTTFTAKKIDGKTSLEWNTAAESNNSHFEIEYSVDARKFEKIGSRAGYGTSGSSHQYHYLDEQVRSSDAYYRLKQVDFDQKFSYSRIVMVPGSALESYISPNPSKDEITIKVNTTESVASVSVFNPSLQKVLQKDGTNKINISFLDPGPYVVVVSTASGATFTTKLIKY